MKETINHERKMAKVYIMKLAESPWNDIHKIGWTNRPDPELRADEVRDSLYKSDIEGTLSVLFCEWFLFAWTLEQLLHIWYKNKNVEMPPTVSGYTEFFDLNFFNVRFMLIPFLKTLHYIQFIMAFILPFILLDLFGIIELTW